MTICHQWAWKPNDAMKTLKQCLDVLLRTVGGDGNLLFNVGPTAEGVIEERQVARLKEMGDWMAKHGDVVYGTRGGPYKPAPWGVATCKGRKVNLIVLNWPAGGEVRLPPLPAAIKGHRTLTGGKIGFSATPEALVLQKGDSAWDGIAAIVELELDQDAFAIPPISGGSALAVKSVRASNVFQNSEDYQPAMAFDGDPDTRWATDGGTRSAWVEFELPAARAVKGLRIVQEHTYAGRIESFRVEYKDGAEWKTAAEGSGTKPEQVVDFAPVTAAAFRLTIAKASDGPTISEISVIDAGS
jgi:alpha-L-fucosidase